MIPVTHNFCHFFKMNIMWGIFRCWEAAESDTILKASMNRIMLWNTYVLSNNDSRPISTFIKHDKATTYQALSCNVIPRCLVHRYQYFGKRAASTVTLHVSTMLMETARSPEITYLPTTCHIPEDNNLHCHFCENLKSHMGLPIWSHKKVISNLSY